MSIAAEGEPRPNYRQGGGAYARLGEVNAAITAHGEALCLHARGDGRTLLLVEGIGGKNISILDVTNPAQIHGIALANLAATGPFDFVKSLNDRAILISCRDQTGYALLDFKTPEPSQHRP
jgi:hypothetical protein